MFDVVNELLNAFVCSKQLVVIIKPPMKKAADQKSLNFSGHEWEIKNGEFTKRKKRMSV